MTPKQYQKIENHQKNIIEEAHDVIDFALELALNCPLPQKIRPAEPKDIIIGNIIWYPSVEHKPQLFWKIVEEVLKPNDDFKAYSAEDGCRYGLIGAYIETT